MSSHKYGTRRALRGMKEIPSEMLKSPLTIPVQSRVGKVQKLGPHAGIRQKRTTISAPRPAPRASASKFPSRKRKVVTMGSLIASSVEDVKKRTQASANKGKAPSTDGNSHRRPVLETEMISSISMPLLPPSNVLSSSNGGLGGSNSGISDALHPDQPNLNRKSVLETSNGQNSGKKAGAVPAAPGKTFAQIADYLIPPGLTVLEAAVEAGVESARRAATARGTPRVVLRHMEQEEKLLASLESVLQSAADRLELERRVLEELANGETSMEELVTGKKVPKPDLLPLSIPAEAQQGVTKTIAEEMEEIGMAPLDLDLGL